MLIRFTPAQWTAISIAAVLDGDPCPRRWVRNMILHLAGLIGPSDIVPGEVPIEEEEDGVL